MPALTPEELTRELQSLPGWQSEGAAITRTCAFPTYLEGVTFATKVAEAAERANHHPDILITYRRVTITLTTHDAGGVTSRDLTLARDLQSLT